MSQDTVNRILAAFAQATGTKIEPDPPRDNNLGRGSTVLANAVRAGLQVRED